MLCPKDHFFHPADFGQVGCAIYDVDTASSTRTLAAAKVVDFDLFLGCKRQDGDPFGRLNRPDLIAFCVHEAHLYGGIYRCIGTRAYPFGHSLKAALNGTARLPFSVFGTVVWHHASAFQITCFIEMSVCIAVFVSTTVI